MSAVVKSLSRRIRLVDFQILATTLAVQRQTGGNLAETLQRMAVVIRDRMNTRRHLRSATAAGRASAMLIATICPLAYLFMFFWQPEHMKILYEDPLGQTMLCVAVALELTGILWVVALLRQQD